MPGNDDDAERVEQLQQQVRVLTRAVADMERELRSEQNGAERHREALSTRMDEMEQGGAQPDDSEDLTRLERYTRMPMHERIAAVKAGEIKKKHLRATLIYDNWDEWAQKGAGGQMVLTTKQTRPGRLRNLLREADPTVDVREGEEMHRPMVYRAMKSVASMSSRAFVYHDQHTTPDNTDSATSKALVLEQPEWLPTYHSD